MDNSSPIHGSLVILDDKIVRDIISSKLLSQRSGHVSTAAIDDESSWSPDSSEDVNAINALMTLKSKFFVALLFSMRLMSCVSLSRIIIPMTFSISTELKRKARRYLSTINCCYELIVMFRSYDDWIP